MKTLGYTNVCRTLWKFWISIQYVDTSRHSQTDRKNSVSYFSHIYTHWKWSKSNKVAEVKRQNKHHSTIISHAGSYEPRIYSWLQGYTYLVEWSFRWFLEIVVPTANSGYRLWSLQEELLSCVSSAGDPRIRARVFQYYVACCFELIAPLGSGRREFVVGQVSQPNVVHQFLFRVIVDGHYA